MKRLAVLAVLALFAATACWPFDETVVLSEMELRREAGTVVVERDGERIEVDDSFALQMGDLIETGSASAARLRLQGGRLASMQSRGRVRVVDQDALEVLAGSLLVDTQQFMTIDFDRVRATSDGGLFRVDRGVATVRTGAYRGVVGLTTPGQPPLTVGRLFEAQVTANDVPSESRPYRLDHGDPWDVRYFGSIVELEEELDGLTRGLANQLGKKRPDLRYFRTLARGTDVSVMKPYLSQPPQDLLVAFIVARNADGSFTAAFAEAYSIFEAGGTWGIVAAIMDVQGRALLADLQDTIIATGIVARGGGGRASFSVAAAVAAGGDAGGVGPSDAGGNEAPGGGGPDPEPPEPTEEPPCAPDDVDCRVQEIHEQIPSPTPTPSPTQQDSGGGGGQDSGGGGGQDSGGGGGQDSGGGIDIIGGVLNLFAPGVFGAW